MENCRVLPEKTKSKIEVGHARSRHRRLSRPLAFIIEKMNPKYFKFIPLAIGLTVGLSLYYSIGWWGFLIIFPWLGLSISIGIYLRQTLDKKHKEIGRRISILLNLPVFIAFIPFANRENLQLEGVILIVLAGYFSKGFIHYAVAKIFGPIIWGRGFCGWACWTGAVLDWLPIKREKQIDHKLKHFRYLALSISVALPVFLIFGLNYDVKNNYLYKSEFSWMIAGNVIYYLLSIPMAFYFKDKRAFCKIACPVSLVMKPTAKFARLRKKPSENLCINCGVCNKECPMDVEIMGRISKRQSIISSECILCNDCKTVCPVEAIK